MSKMTRLLFQICSMCHNHKSLYIKLSIISPLAVRPEEAPPPSKRPGFWDSFAANWAAKKQAEAAAAAAAANDASVADGQDEEGATAAGGQDSQDGQVTMEEVSEGGGSNNSFSKYMSLGGGSEEVSFKWNFVTSKLAELKTKTN